MDDGISFLELMSRKCSGKIGIRAAFRREDQRLLHMDPNKLLDPGLLAYLRRQLQG
jgi:hypothetical protein